MQPTPRIIYEFGPFRLDFQRHAFTRSGQPVSLPPKAFDILVMLLDRRDTLVSKTDLLSHIWPNSFVEENNLAQHVSLLRKTLGEANGNLRYIETVPRIGYRFVGEVRLVQNGHENGAAVESPALQPPVTELPQPPAIAHRILRSLLLLAGTTLAGLLFFFLWPNSTPAVLDHVQLTHDGYFKHGPLMTDNEFVYFAENRSGKDTLVRVLHSGGEPVVLPAIPARLQPLDLSPARHQLLALEAGPTGSELPLWVGSPVTGEFRRLGTILANSAAWLPGGDRIFYSRGHKLFISNSDGGDSKELLEAPGRLSRLLPSPDGRVLVFGVQRPQSSMDELWEVRLEGTRLRQISPGVSPEIRHPAGAWLDRPEYFLFSETSEAKFWLWGLRKPLFGTEKRVRINTGLLNVVDIAADRHKLLAIGAMDRAEIVRYNEKSGSLEPFLPGVSADGLAFSRQGDWVAYTTYPDRRLVRSRLDGSDRRQLTTGRNTGLLPAWSPDGKRIAYMESSGASPWKIHLVSNDSGASEELLSGSDDEGNPTWSPDGAALIFAGVPWVKGFAAESTAIHQVDLRSRRVVTLPGSAGLWSPRWSPDGKFVVAETIDSQNLMLFDFSRQTWKPLANLRGELIGYTSWSHDSRFVYYNGYVHQTGAIYRVDVLGGTTEVVRSANEPGAAITLGQWFTLAPDDSPLLLRDTSVNEVFALDLRLP